MYIKRQKVPRREAVLSVISDSLQTQFEVEDVFDLHLSLFIFSIL